MFTTLFEGNQHRFLSRAKLFGQIRVPSINIVLTSVPKSSKWSFPFWKLLSSWIGHYNNSVLTESSKTTHTPQNIYIVTRSTNIIAMNITNTT
jgi:hypothetical protein